MSVIGTSCPSDCKNHNPALLHQGRPEQAENILLLTLPAVTVLAKALHKELRHWLMHRLRTQKTLPEYGEYTLLTGHGGQWA